MTEKPKSLGVEIHTVSSLDTSGDAEFELFENGEPRDLGEAIGLAIGAASMTWPIIGGVFRDAKARRISDALEMYVRDELDKLKEELRLERQVSATMDARWTPPPRTPPQLAAVLQAVVDEYFRAKAKHGEKTMDGPGYTSEQRLAILVEEGGEVSEEVANAALQAIIGRVGHALTYDQPGVEGGHLGRLLKELVQVAAMAVTWGSVLVPGKAAEQPAEPQKLAEVAPGATVFFYDDPAVPVAVTGAGSQVKVTDQMVALMVPRDQLGEVIDRMGWAEPPKPQQHKPIHGASCWCGGTIIEGYCNLGDPNEVGP